MKKWIILFLIFSLVIGLESPCLATENNRFLQEVELTENTLVIYTDAFEKGNEYSVSLGGENLPLQVQTIKEADEPITFYCLVDVSGTMSGAPLSLTKKTLTALSKSMRSEDNMVVATFDDQVSAEMPLQKGKRLQKAIKNISIGKGDTNLYSAIIESIDLMSSEQIYHTKKCLIIFSDGEDYQDNGATKTEVLRAIREADFPLYTVATMTQSDQLSGGKILGSFGRASAGGAHFTTADEEGSGGNIQTDLSGSDIAKSIWKDMISGAVITADLTNYVLDQERNEISLKVTLSADSQDLTETKTILTDDLSKVISIEEESETEPPAETESIAEESSMQETSKSDEKHGTSMNPLPFIMGGIVLLLAVIGIVLFLRKRGHETSEQDVSDSASRENSDADNSILTDKDKGNRSSQTDGEEQEKKKEISVFMLEIPYGRNPVSFTLSSQGIKKTIGRNDTADFVLNAADNKLSGVHFALIFRDHKYYIMDEDSTNGTLLNGVNIAHKGWCPLFNGDKIRAGEMEYRIMFEENALNNKVSK